MNGPRAFRAERLVPAAALVLILGVGLAMASGPIKIGELQLASVKTPAPYGPVDSGKRWVVQYPGATYIRVHFSEFDLAPGDFVRISDASGAVVHTYRGRGPHDNGHFWAFTTPGDTAIVTLQADVGGAAGFQIDKFGRGTVPVFEDPQPESVCGTNDWQDVECYRGTSYDLEFQQARGAVKAIIGCCSSCTAFKVSDSGQFMTNNHCTSSSSGVRSTELLMDFKNNSCGGGGSSNAGSVMGQNLLRTDYTLDYTLMTSTGDSDAIPCLELDARLAPAGERLYIAGHPNGGVKKLSVESTHSSNPNGVCEVDASPYSGRGPNSDIGYYCDTTGGSSGSPVLSGDTHKVIAIHHFGGCLNSGVRMDLIFDQISGQLDSCAGGGGGDPPTCSNKGESCTFNSDCCSGKCKGKPGRKTCK